MEKGSLYSRPFGKAGADFLLLTTFRCCGSEAMRVAKHLMLFCLLLGKGSKEHSLSRLKYWGLQGDNFGSPGSC